MYSFEDYRWCLSHNIGLFSTNNKKQHANMKSLYLWQFLNAKLAMCTGLYSLVLLVEQVHEHNRDTSFSSLSGSGLTDGQRSPPSLGPLCIRWDILLVSFAGWNDNYQWFCHDIHEPVTPLWWGEEQRIWPLCWRWRLEGSLYCQSCLPR